MITSRCFAAALLIAAVVIALATWWTSPVDHGAMYDEHVRLKQLPRTGDGTYYKSEGRLQPNTAYEGCAVPCSGGDCGEGDCWRFHTTTEE